MLIRRLAKDSMATDPPVSEAQRKAMGAAKSGHSTLGIPASVGKEFIDADPGGKLPEKKGDAAHDAENDEDQLDMLSQQYREAMAEGDVNTARLTKVAMTLLLNQIKQKKMSGSKDELPEQGVIPAVSASDAAPFRFACDAVPDCTGRIVKTFGNHTLIIGIAQDHGAWFTRGPEGFRKHGSQREALAHIEYAQDAVENVEGSKETKEGKARRAGQQFDDIAQVHGGKIEESGGKFKATDVGGITTTHDSWDEAVAALGRRVKIGGGDQVGSNMQRIALADANARRRNPPKPDPSEKDPGKFSAREDTTHGLPKRGDAELFPGSSKPNPELAKLYGNLSARARKQDEESNKRFNKGVSRENQQFGGYSRSELEGMDIEKATVSYVRPQAAEPLTAAEKAQVKKEGGALPKDGFDWVGAANGDQPPRRGEPNYIGNRNPPKPEVGNTMKDFRRSLLQANLRKFQSMMDSAKTAEERSNASNMYLRTKQQFAKEFPGETP